MSESETFGASKGMTERNAMTKTERTKAWQRVTGFLWSAGPCFVVVAALIFLPHAARAAWKGYDGTVDISNQEFYMRAGEIKTITLTYTNTGDEVWLRGTGEGTVNLYVVDQSSELKDASWIDHETAGQINSVSVAPGGTADVTLRIRAPRAGTFTEVFRLAANNVAWMRSAETLITVHVAENGVVYPPGSSEPEPESDPATEPTASEPEPELASSSNEEGSLAAVLLLKSTKKVELAGGDTAILTYGFKNTGDAAWDTRALELSAVQTAIAGASESWVRDDSWESATRAVTERSVTKPGEIGFLSFTLKAPPKRGSYTVRFALFANNARVDGAYVDIPVTVTSDGAYELETPSTPASSAVSSYGNIPQAPDYTGTEPVVRVGLFRTVDDQMKIKGFGGSYRAFQGAETICSFTAEQETTVLYDRTNAVYKLSGPDCTSQSTEPYRFERTDTPWEPLEMSDYHRPVSWYPGADDNTFRGILELRYAADDPDHDVWTINELPMELYLRGIAETSDVSPLEYQKALLIAARTYGYYHWSRGTKHASRGFQIDGKYDQVYRSYGAEARSPKIVQAVTETRGQIVTYNGKLAITPYFSRSDGRTRDWDEVWYGGDNYPWLKSVPVPQDEGRTLWGHGVGMSATGALDMANEGRNYVEILKHFYTGIEIMSYY